MHYAPGETKHQAFQLGTSRYRTSTPKPAFAASVPPSRETVKASLPLTPPRALRSKGLATNNRSIWPLTDARCQDRPGCLARRLLWARGVPPAVPRNLRYLRSTNVAGSVRCASCHCGYSIGCDESTAHATECGWRTYPWAALGACHYRPGQCGRGAERELSWQGTARRYGLNWTK